jgi:hypothetical protein
VKIQLSHRKRPRMSQALLPVAENDIAKDDFPDILNIFLEYFAT